MSIRRGDAVWLWRVTTVAVLCVLAPSVGVIAQHVTDGRAQLTVWLMPNEPAERVEAGANINAEVEQFNQDLAKRFIVVLNTSDNDLRQQLLRWNPEFAVPEWRIIKGQRESLHALGAFAEKSGVRVRVLIVNWGQAFGELRRTLEGKEGNYRPDVAQIGSTWVAYFKEKDLLLAPSKNAAGELLWRQFPKSGPTTLRYIFDIRLLYYWKRLPNETATDKAFDMKSDSWETLIESLRREDVEGKGTRPPMAFPIGGGPNVLHDYAPLVWAGGGKFLDEESSRVDLTSAAALKTPLLLNVKARFTDRQGTVHRLIDFPRMSHEEVLSPHFMRGQYRAVIEPVAFLRRWKKDFDDVKCSGKWTGPPEASFWDFCGVAVPPIPFKGGSDLMVVKATAHPDVAFDLAKFLASDTTCIERLAVLGQLPAQDQANGFGTEKLLDKLGEAEVPREAIESVIARAVAAGREYPPFARFASNLESPETLDAMQDVWQRLSEGARDGSEGDALQSAARNAEQTINRRINTWIQVRHLFERYWLHVSAGVLVALIALLLWGIKGARRRIAEEREKNRLLEQVRTVRGFAASALHLVDSAHNLRFKPAFHSSAIDEQTVKALMIRAGLRGWRRGQSDSNWETGRLDETVWQAILVAIDIVYDSRVFSDWENQGTPCARSFLEERGLLRNGRRADEANGAFEIRAESVTGQSIQMPLMLEHLLVCLLTNALKASRVQAESVADQFQTIRIAYERQSDSLVVCNELAPGASGLSPVVAQALNESKSIDEFERRIEELLREPPASSWPGIGLVEAYCVAMQCYGGLAVVTNGSSVSVRIQGICGVTP